MRHFAFAALAAGLLAGTHAWQIYLKPDVRMHNSDPELSTTQTRLVLAHHLGLDELQAIGNQEHLDWWSAHLHASEQLNFVGQGLKSGLILEVDSDHPEDFLPASFAHPTFTTESPSIPNIVNKFTSDAALVFSSVYTTEKPHPEAEYSPLLDIFDLSDVPLVKAELAPLLAFFDEDMSEEFTFGSFSIRSLAHVADVYGRDSEQYTTLARTIRAILDKASMDDQLRMALVVGSPSHSRRAEPPQQPLPPYNAPIYASGTCHRSAEKCTNATDSCSGHGTCVGVSKSGRECFVCQCSVTKDEKGRREWWSGNSCQKQDVSVSFALLVGTAAFMSFLIAGAVVLLYSIGNDELPNTLTGGAVAAKRD